MWEALSIKSNCKAISSVCGIQHSVYEKEVVKENVIGDHLANNAFEDYKSLNFDFLEEDVLLVDERKKENKLVDHIFWWRNKYVW